MKRASTDSELPGRSAPPMSSLFGQPASSQAPSSTSAFPPTSSLFGQSATQASNSNSTSAFPPTSSLFNQSASQAPNSKSSSAFPPTSSLFGQAAPQAPSSSSTSALRLTSSLFGGQSAAQAPNSTSVFPPTSSLFADLAKANSEQKSKPEASSNQFSGLKLNSQPETNSTGGGGGFFGVGNPQTQGSSIFANTANPSAPTALGNTAVTNTAPSLFANPTNTSSQNQAGQSQQQNGQTAASSAHGTKPAFFNSLLERGKKRAHDAHGGSGPGDLPSLQLGLGDIARRARELGRDEDQAQRGGLPDSRA